MYTNSSFENCSILHTFTKGHISGNTPLGVRAGHFRQLRIGCKLWLSPPRRNHAHFPFFFSDGIGPRDCNSLSCGGKAAPCTGKSESTEKSLDERRYGSTSRARTDFHRRP